MFKVFIISFAGAIVTFVWGIFTNDWGWERTTKILVIASVLCSGVAAFVVLVSFIILVLKVFGVAG